MAATEVTDNKSTNDNPESLEKPPSSQSTDTPCLRSCIANPKLYIILSFIAFLYSIILVAIHWTSTCHGLSATFTWKYYLITTIALFIIYKLYLIILSQRCCLRLTLKPQIGLLVHIFIGNAVLLLLWLIYGFLDWFQFANHADCSNTHLTYGYLSILILYSLICLMLSIQQCMFGVSQYSKRMEQKRYITSKSRKHDISDKAPPIKNTEQNEEKINVQLEMFTIPEEKLKEFVAEYDYFDGLDFSRSNIMESTPDPSAPAATAANETANTSPANRRQVGNAMPTLDEMQSKTVRMDGDVQNVQLDAPRPALSRHGTGRLSRSAGVSFSNLFLGEAREMSSTMFLNYKQQNSDDDNLMCMVCLEQFKPHDSIGKLMCNHIFHKQCIYQWLKKNATCPLCREDVERFANVPFL